MPLPLHIFFTIRIHCSGTSSYTHSHTSERLAFGTISYALQVILHLPVFLYQLPRCTGGTCCPSARHETERILYYACLPRDPSINFSFLNLSTIIHRLDASIFSTIVYVSLLFEDWYDHTVSSFLWHFILLYPV